MITVPLVLYILALIFLILAALGVPSSRVNLGWLGLACWLLGSMITGR